MSATIDKHFTGETNKEFAQYKLDLAYDCASGIANHLSNWLGDDAHITAEAWQVMESLEQIQSDLDEIEEDGSKP